MAEAQAPGIPVYMRVGDGPEVHVGTITPELSRDDEGTATLLATVPSLATVLRATADAMDEAEGS
jgi:hypothetical protein